MMLLLCIFNKSAYLSNCIAYSLKKVPIGAQVEIVRTTRTGRNIIYAHPYHVF